VGGDWYDAIPLGDGRFGLAIGDVAGHGVESAAFMARLRNALRAYAIEDPSPSGVVERLDRLVDRLEPDVMATLTYLVSEPAERRLALSSAGHPSRCSSVPAARWGSSAQGARRRWAPAPCCRGGRTASNCRPSRWSSCTRMVSSSDATGRSTRGLAESARIAPPEPERACEALLEQVLAGEAVADDVAVLVMRTAALEGSAG
jgi:hypothetical protein